MSLEVRIAGGLRDEPRSRLIQAAMAGLYEEGSAILADSQEHYVPVDEAVLKGSGYVEPPHSDGHEIRVTIGYGGPATAYATAVHEHLSEHSPRAWRSAEEHGDGVHFSPSGHGPKYLERPLLRAIPGLATRLLRRMRRRLGVN